MHVVMSGAGVFHDPLEAMDRAMEHDFMEEFYKRLEELWAYVGLFRINDRRRTTRKEEILRRQRADRATKVQTLRSIDRTLAPFRDPQLDPQYLLVRQLGSRFDELTRASFPQDLIHIILTQAKEAGAKMLYLMRAALPRWLVVIAPGGSPWNGYRSIWQQYTNPNVTHRVTYSEQDTGQPFSWNGINARGDRLVSSNRIYGPGY